MPHPAGRVLWSCGRVLRTGASPVGRVDKPVDDASASPTALPTLSRLSPTGSTGRPTTRNLKNQNRTVLFVANTPKSERKRFHPRMAPVGAGQVATWSSSTTRTVKSPREAQGLDFLPVDSRDRELTVASGFDMHSGVDAEYVLVPRGFGHRRVPGDDTAHAFDRSLVFVPGLTDLPLSVPVSDPAPKGTSARQVTQILVSTNPLLEVLPLSMHR